MIEAPIYALPPAIPLAKQSDFPHRGWNYIRCEDRETPDHLCEYCGKQHVRYIHILGNDDWPDLIETGCVCAADLGLKEEALNGEKNTRNRTSRLQSFMQNGWKTTKNGNPYKNYLGMRVSIFQAGRYFRISINSKAGLRNFREQADAMKHAFNYIEGRRR